MRATRLLILVLCVLPLGCAPTPFQPAAPTAIPRAALSSRTSAHLDAHLESEMRKRRIPGLTCAIVSDGRLIHTSAHGFANLQHRVPVTSDSIFELASLTKAMTAAAVLLLVEDGKLNLDASITTYLDNAPESWRPITVRHLLNHTSGLAPTFQGFTHERANLQQSRVSAADAFASTARAPLSFQPPGTHFLYSDPGYFILGLIIDRISGMSYRDFMTRRIFQPLGMSHTTLKDPRLIVPNEAQGYTIRDGQLGNIGRWYYWEIPAAFGAMSNLADIARWDAALYTDALLTSASRAMMFTSAALANASPTGYGCGWFLWTQRGHTVQQHTGRTGTEIVRLPDDRFTIIVLTNLGPNTADSTEVNSWGLAMRIAEMLVPGLGRAPIIEQPMSRKLMNELVGAYASPDGSWRIREQSGELFLESGGIETRIFILGADQFTEAEEDLIYTIERAQDSSITAIELRHISGWSERATKITPTAP